MKLRRPAVIDRQRFLRDPIKRHHSEDSDQERLILKSD